MIHIESIVVLSCISFFLSLCALRFRSNTASKSVGIAQFPLKKLGPIMVLGRTLTVLRQSHQKSDRRGAAVTSCAAECVNVAKLPELVRKA